MSKSITFRELAPELWDAELHLYEGGMHHRMRMTVVRRQKHLLWLHSPVSIDDPLADKLAELGSVEDIVAPNRFHYRFAAAAKARYPGATLWSAPGLAEKRSSVPFDRVLSDNTPWSDDLLALFIDGAPMWSEHVFFHPASHTLICTDLLFNIRDEAQLVSRLLYRGLGVWRRFGSNRLWPWLAKDRRNLDASIERILGWDVRQVVMAHGDVQEIQDREQLRRALEPLRTRA
jgi:hypothetical protein